MYSFLSFILAIIISIVILIVFAKLKILDALAAATGCGGAIIVRLLLVVGIFLFSLFLSNIILEDYFKRYDLPNTYFTTRVKLSSYDKVLKEPYGKETGTINEDTVLRVKRGKKKGTVTWLECYILENNQPKHLFVLIPEAPIDLKSDCKYFYYNEKSKSFAAYYEQIDTKNNVNKKRLHDEYLQALADANITIQYSNDNVLRESIKQTHYFLPKDGFLTEGYLGAFESKVDGDFYYISIEDKKLFKKITNTYTKKYRDEELKYFD